MSNLSYQLINLIIRFAFFAISISVHECAHAYAAYRLGDSTAKDQGRITLNPLKHLDPLGTLMIFLISFGWAKPTPVNAMYFKDRKKGVMITSLAGPMSNLLFAIVLAFPYVYFRSNLYTTVNIYLYNIFAIGLSLNIALAIFNMLPIPPLDGSKILSGILPSRQYYKMLEYENYIVIAFVILMFTGILGRILWPLIQWVQDIIVYFVTPIIGLIF